MNDKKIWSIFTKIRKCNPNMHTYAMGEVFCYWTQPEVKKKILFREEVDVEVKAF